MIDLRKVFFVFIVCVGLFGCIMTQNYMFCIPLLVIAFIGYYVCFQLITTTPTFNFNFSRQQRHLPREYYKGHFFSP